MAHCQESCPAEDFQAVPRLETEQRSVCLRVSEAPRCGFWEPCVWAQKEAERLRQTMKLETQPTEKSCRTGHPVSESLGSTTGAEATCLEVSDDDVPGIS